MKDKRRKEGAGGGLVAGQAGGEAWPMADARVEEERKGKRR